MVVEVNGAEVVGEVLVVRDADVVMVDDSDLDVGVDVTINIMLVDEGVTVGCMTTVVVDMSTPVHRYEGPSIRTKTKTPTSNSATLIAGDTASTALVDRACGVASWTTCHLPIARRACAATPDITQPRVRDNSACQADGTARIWPRDGCAI